MQVLTQMQMQDVWKNKIVCCRISKGGLARERGEKGKRGEGEGA